VSTLTNIRTRPLMPGFGAEILDVDLARADAETLKGVVETFHRHGAIMLRGQKMDPGQLTAFIAQFGEPEDHTLKEYTVPGYPKVYRLSNRIVDGKPIGAHNDGVGWHTDYSYKAEPVMATMLYAVEVPPEGSDTLVADCVAAWNALPPERQEALEGKVLHHSYQYFMATREYGARELSDELKAENPDVYHPLVRTHPADGRKALWPSTGTVIEVMGVPKEEGLKLVEELVEFATQDRFVYRHKWQAGDVLMWDNRCTLHTGTLYDDTKYIREMHRLWVRGDRPY
jgi:taurine dioxygenase